jgi:predicted transcriptional regulator
MARNGLLSHLESDEGFQATLRVMDALGLESIEFNHKTAQPIEEQFWE